MKLKTKRLLAAALALSLTANISLAAFASTYYLDDGDITIDGNTDGDYVNVTQNETTTQDTDDEIVITQNEEHDTSDATNYTVTIEGDVDTSITITDVNIEVDENSTNDAAITIEENSTVSDLTIDNSTITVDEEGASGIEIGTGSEVDMTLSGDNEIILNEGNTSGIQVGTTDAEDGENTTVNITIDGTTTIGEGVTTDEDGNTTSKVVNTNESLDTVANMTGGITVGGGMYDGADGVDSDESGTSTTVTITSGEEGGTLNIGETDTTAGVSTGILVHDGASVIIGDDDEERNLLEVNINGTHRTYANVENNHTNDIFVTVSGNGIAAYGDVTITGKTEVNIEDTDLRGISMTGADLTISDGATVNINGVGGDSDNLEQETIKGATDSGTSNTYAGIYASGSSVYVDNATLNVDDVQNAHGGTNFGVALDNTGNQEFVISDGATVDISNVTGGTGIGIAGNNLLEIDRSDVTVSGARDGIYLNQGALLYVHSTKMEDTDNILESGDDREVYKDENGETVTRYTNLTLKDLDGNAITAYGASVEFIGDQVLVTIDTVGNTGITMGVPYDSKTGKFTDVDEDNNVNERHLYVRDSAQLVMKSVAYVGILVGNEDGGSDYNKVVEITGDAYVEIGTLGGHGNSIILWGGNNSLLVDDSTVEVEDDITFLNTMGKDPSTITINNGSKVVARSIRNYNGGVYNFYITGGTVEVGEVDSSVNAETSLNVTDATSLAVNSLLWPTSGIENGDENLTNFRLSVSELEDLLGEDIVAELKEAGTDLSEEDKEKYLTDYGFVIEYDDEGNYATLTFQTYGYKGDAYYEYNAEKDNGTETKWYVVDLTKYYDEDGNFDDDLWVWTPAVVLSYFELVNDNTLSSAEPSDESDPKDVTVGSSLTDNHDVVVRGQSIAFGNFQTDENYNTTELSSTAYAIAKATADDMGIVLYIYDAMDEGVAGTVSEEDLEGKTIIVQGDDGKYYTVTVNEDGSTSGSEEIGTYYYALTDDNGAFIKVMVDENGYIVLDDAGNFILDENGEYVYTDEDGNLTVMVNGELVDNVRIIVSGTSYAILDDDGTYSSTDSDGNPVTKDTDGAIEVATAVYYYAQTDDDGNTIYVDADGNVLTDSNSTEFVLVVLGDDETYVLYDEETGKYYLVNANGEKTVVVTGEELDMASLWEEFNEYTRVRSNSAATDNTEYNYENVFGGKADPVEAEDGGESVVSLEVDEEEDDGEEDDGDDPEPIIPIVPIIPVTPDTPAQPETPAETPTETPEETPAETPADPEAPAETPETPASSTPKTGDESNVAIYLVMAALSGAALIGLGVTGRKKNEEV